MDAHEVQRLLRADAARFDEELAAIDSDDLAARVFARLGIVPPVEPVSDPLDGQQGDEHCG